LEEIAFLYSEDGIMKKLLQKALVSVRYWRYKKISNKISRLTLVRYGLYEKIIEYRRAIKKEEKE
jgi:hypothetical protein